MASKLQNDSTKIILLISLALGSQVVRCSTHSNGETHFRRDSCDSQNYRDLLALKDAQNCIAENEVWGMLDSLYHQANGSDCMKQAIMHLSGIFSDPKHNPYYCVCYGSNILLDRPNVPDFRQHMRDCSLNDQVYTYLYERHYHMDQTKYYQQPPHCSTHHAVWPALASIGSDICRNDIVQQVAALFGSYGDQCSCEIKTGAGTEIQHTISTTNQTTSQPKLPSVHCLQYESYTFLYNLSLNVDLCVSSNNMWTYLADLQHRDAECRKEIMNHMAAIFQDYEQSQNYCFCAEHGSHQVKIRQALREETYCKGYHEAYKFLHDQIFTQMPSACRSHQYLWGKLARITVGELETDCRKELIEQAAATYPKTENDPCSCSQATVSPTLSVTTMTTSSTVKPTSAIIEPFASTTFSVPASTASTAHKTTIKQVTEHLAGLHACSNSSTIFSIAHMVAVAHPNASMCTTGYHNSSEALVLISCNIDSTATWRKGENVMGVCERLPLYTPIATFKTNGVYEPNGGKAGVFLGCLQNGFKFAVQDCDFSIRIQHLESGGVLANDPSNYFVVRW